ncbi:unnamed protein product [Fraxinus pennsylvanica]|uniref:YTH domain-containing family protein n=1 Tax=Fraxinus pennsylvanica TaxID=56036 RepID=A0AAD1Z9L0_9LAMI|nr:unnamed protein product [Fraxinus pennsylvanica]
MSPIFVANTYGIFRVSTSQVSRKDEMPSASLSFASSINDATSRIKGIVIDQTSGSEQGVYYPPTSYCDYYYPGYNGSIAQSDDKDYFNTVGGSYRTPFHATHMTLPILEMAQLALLLNLLGSEFHSNAVPNGFQPVGFFIIHKLKHRWFHALWSRLTRGPRAKSNNNSTQLSAEEQPGLAIPRDNYNLEEFQIQYDRAKFYVIKPYSEDGIASNMTFGQLLQTENKKLDAAFCNANAITCESGAKYPVFLFFSVTSLHFFLLFCNSIVDNFRVNTSGQFIGVAEMIGQFDFDKNMDFWQLD